MVKICADFLPFIAHLKLLVVKCLAVLTMCRPLQITEATKRRLQAIGELELQ